MSKTAKPNAGKEMESAVAKIERSLGRDPTVTEILAPVRLRDRTTGEWREHDVLVTHKAGHHLLRTAIECRDRSRKVGVPDIEAFAAKCRDTGIDRAVIVSLKGFAGTALKKAAHENVRCHVLQEVDGVPVAFLGTRLHSPTGFFGWTFTFDVGNRQIFRDDGSLYDFDVEMKPYIADFVGLTHERSPGCVNEVWYPIPCDNLYVRDSATGVTYRFKDFHCVVSGGSEEVGNVRSMTYSDLLRDEVIATTSTVTFPDGSSFTLTATPTALPMSPREASTPLKPPR